MCVCERESEIGRQSRAVILKNNKKMNERMNGKSTGRVYNMKTSSFVWHSMGQPFINLLFCSSLNVISLFSDNFVSSGVIPIHKSCYAFKWNQRVEREGKNHRFLFGQRICNYKGRKYYSRRLETNTNEWILWGLNFASIKPPVLQHINRKDVFWFNENCQCRCRCQWFMITA